MVLVKIADENMVEKIAECKEALEMIIQGFRKVIDSSHRFKIVASDYEVAVKKLKFWPMMICTSKKLCIALIYLLVLIVLRALFI